MSEKNKYRECDYVREKRIIIIEFIKIMKVRGKIYEEHERKKLSSGLREKAKFMIINN